MNWEAKWIWAKSRSRTRNFYVYARKEVDLESTPLATACVTCSSEYKLYFNGRHVGRGPGPCRPQVQYYDQYDLKRYLRPGRNVIGALCYNPGVDMVGGFLFQMELGNGDADKLVVATDETWKVLPAEDYESASDDLGFREFYDSRKKPVGWNVVGYYDSSWDEPEVIGEVGAGPWVELVRRPIPPLRMREAFPEKVVSCGGAPCPDNDREKSPAKPGQIKNVRRLVGASRDVAVAPVGVESTVILDFGREVVGFPTIRVRDGRYGVVDLAYGEILDSNGALDRAGQSDRVILHGGRQEWQSFGRRVFRYMQLTFRDLDQPVHIESVSLVEVGYPATQAWSFECSDDLLNEIYRTGVYTLGLCMQETYETSPLTDPSQRLGPARIQAVLNYYSFFESDLAAKALRELVPSNESVAPGCPDEALIWVMMLHDYYLYTGDRHLVEELYSALWTAISDRLRAIEGDDGLPHGHGGDACPVCGAFYYQALRDASKLAAVLDRHDDSVLWHSRADAVFHMFNSTFPRDALSTRAMAASVAFGLADARNSESIRANGGLITGGDIGWSLYALQAMARLGMIDEALEQIRAIWGGMLQCGTTAWWDAFDPASGAASPTSRCYAASGAPTYFLLAEVLGIKPSTPQSPVVIIQPHTGDLEWAKGGFSTHPGFLEVEWRHTKDAFQIDINGPDGFIVALPVAGFKRPIIEEHDLNPETPERRARKTYGWGNVIWRDGEEHDPYVDWLKTQEEEPPEYYEPRARCQADDDYIWVRESVSTHVRYIVREG